MQVGRWRHVREEDFECSKGGVECVNGDVRPCYSRTVVSLWMYLCFKWIKHTIDCPRKGGRGGEQAPKDSGSYDGYMCGVRGYIPRDQGGNARYTIIVEKSSICKNWRMRGHVCKGYALFPEPARIPKISVWMPEAQNQEHSPI